MRLRVDQLTSHLQRADLALIYCLSGDEPLQLMEAADTIRKHARGSGISERSILEVVRGFDWNLLLQESANLSLFSSKRLIELRLGDQKPGKPGSDALSAYAAGNMQDTCLLITCAKLDKQAQQTRWFKAIDKIGVIIQVWPVEPSRLPEWIIQRMKQSGRQIDRDAAELIAQRTEGNLLAAKQELDKLILIVDGQKITLADAVSGVVDNARFDVFSLIEYAFTGNRQRIVEMLRGLRQEGVEPIAVNAAIMWEVRRLYTICHELSEGMPRDRVFTSHRVWKQRQGAFNSIMKRISRDSLNRILDNANAIEKSLKGASKNNPWELMESLLLQLAGITLHPASGH